MIINLHRSGKQTLGSHRQNLLCTRTQEKGAVTHKRLTQTCLCVSRSLQRWSTAGSRTPSVAMCAQDLLKEVAIIFIASTVVWSQVKTTGREHSLAHQQKVGLKIY